MKVLLVGEFSGFYTALKVGLVQLGHEVMTLSGGDSWKGFAADWPLYSGRGGLRGKIDRNLLLPARGLARALQFRPDVVQFVNPLVLAPRWGLLGANRLFFNALINSAKRSYLSCAGDDAVYWRASDALAYSPKRDQLRFDFQGREPEFLGDEALRWNEELATRVTGIIPIAYDYAIGYRRFPNLRATIPLPFVPLGSEPERLGFEGRLRVYHGVTRRGFKGSAYILDAFDELRKSHGEVFDFVVGKPIPYREYVEALSGVQVLVDQTNSYSYGMNALLGLSLGKVVLSGAEPEALAELSAPDCPIVNIRPSVESVKSAILELERDRTSASLVAAAGPSFVARVHDPRTIASLYLNAWSA